MLAQVAALVLAANAALLLAWGLLMLIDGALMRAGLARAWTLRRRLAGTAWGMGIAVPVILAALPAMPVNATDLLVAEYLAGNRALTAVSATTLATAIEWRDALPRFLAEAEGPIWQAAGATLLLAALARAVSVARSGLQLRRLIGAAVPVRQRAGLRIAVSHRCAVPFAARGLRRGHIVMPHRVWADPRARRLAVAHELQHLRQGDPTLEIAIALLSPLFALNPAFWSLARRTRRLREHGCDAACVARGSVDARAYSLCLLDVARHAATRRGGPGTLTVALLGRRQMTGGTTRSQLGHRIEQIASGPERRAGGLVTVALLAGFATAGIGGAMLLRAPDSWSHERLMLSSVVNLERLASINALGQRPPR